MSATYVPSESTARAGSDTTTSPRWSPYPGLRPFLSGDSEYFYGRDIEANEVVARLREKRFVAIIGGSGSGKSSLVLAGAIPRLRTFAIKEAGDFWRPIVSTPGTNHVEGDSPIQRLARKFCGELIDSVEASKRLEDCAKILRGKNGLGELVERFGKQLKGSAGVSLDLLQVNFLFLFDQFEELFHPSNSRDPIAADCQELVDRIVEQFKKPHPQICIALTMRSEHLNDCPRYEDLPDAINAASYLVKRLGTDELRSAIEQPVLRYLRKHAAEQRSARRQARLEGSVVATAAPTVEHISIEPKLIDRLLDDSKAVLAQQDHADHLPLLQHVLFWIWHEASMRCAKESMSMVDALTLDDLWRAVSAMPGTDVHPLEPSVNTLEACLENRCEAIFVRSTAYEQNLWEAGFRSLAFKEPNAGTYTQQRASMAELCQRLGLAAADNDALIQHLQPWMQPHGYLHWDLDSRTVKVAHETLIRRWQRFRRWIDEEDRQFHVYLRLLEDCERWKDAQRSEWALSGGDTLRRYEDERLPTILKDPVRVARIHSLLGMDRDGQRLATVTDTAVRFLDLSIQSRGHREQARKHEEDKIRRIKFWRWGLTLGLFGFLLFSISEWMLARRERTLHRGYALAAETQVKLQPQFANFDAAKSPLRHALQGSYFFQAGSAQYTGPAAIPPFRWLYSPRIDGLQSTAMLGEVRNIASLRSVLRNAVWPVPPRADIVSWLRPTSHWTCNSVFFNGVDQTESFEGAKFYAGSSMADKRGLIVTARGVQGLALFVGRKTADGKGCDIEKQLISAPADTLRIGIAADLSNLVFEFEKYFQFYAIVWGSSQGVGTQPRAVINKRETESLGSDAELVQTLPSDYSAFATDIQIAGRVLRLFDVESTPISKDDAMAGEVLEKARPQSVCAAFAKAQNLEDGRDDVWAVKARNDPRTYCLHIKAAQAGPNEVSSLFLASLYAFDNEAQAGDSRRHLPLFLQEVVGSARPTNLRIGVASQWLAFQGVDGDWRALPWGLRAWRGLATNVFAAPIDKRPSLLQRAWECLIFCVTEPYLRVRGEEYGDQKRDY